MFLVDSCSKNIEAVKELLRSFESEAGKFSVSLIREPQNSGIAHALNVICNKAIEAGFEQILLLDQDSVSTPGMVETLAQHASDRVGMIALMILDRNKHDIKNVKKYLNSKVFKVKSGAHGDVITSGTLVNLKACAFIGGFDDSFFIDYVDYDFNKRLLLEGYDIIRTDETALIHECGKAEKTWLFLPFRDENGKRKFKRFYSFGHSPFRCYYKVRNRILYTKKYAPIGAIEGKEGEKQIPFIVICTLLCEKNKREKLKEFRRGIKDGKAQRVKPYKIKRLPKPAP